MTRAIRHSAKAHMKSYSAVSVLLLLTGASAGVAQNGPAPVCLRSIDIDHTKTPNAHTVLYFMKDGKVWRGSLRSDCPDLVFNGFEYAPTPRESICANMQTIRVLKTGAICEVGPLVPAQP
jgi:hypothetical protein